MAVLPQVIEGYNRIYGRREDGHNRLHVRQFRMENGQEVMQSSFTITEDDLELLRKGGSLVVTIAGSVHPPIALDVIPRY